MKAVVVRHFGGPENLTIEEVEDPVPLENEVIIDVEYAGVGLVDTIMRKGKFDFVQRPFVPGIEVSGRIKAIGDGVSNLLPGQAVAALLTDFSTGGMGGYAQVTRAQAALTVAVPDEADLAAAAAMVVNGATAFMATEALSPGARVAISGASGGLGQALLIAARSAGATEIIAVTRNAARHEALRALGATSIITPEEFAKVSLDVAFDTTGGHMRQRLAHSLRPRGVLMLLGNASGQDTPLSGDAVWLQSLTIKGLSVGGLSHLEPARIAGAAARALAAISSSPIGYSALPFEQVQQAHHALEEGQGPGKFILRID